MPAKPRINVPAPGKHYICKFCQKSFLSESRYESHECQQKRRFTELQTPLGRTAYQYYQLWMKLHHRHSSGETSFLASRYYGFFVRFTKFVQKINLPDVTTFIKLMVIKKLEPFMWTRDDVYQVYLEHLGKHLTPMEHAVISMKTLSNYAKRQGIDESEVFNVLHPNEVIAMIREHRLSPWVLLNSRSFIKMLATRTDPEQRVIIETIIHPDVWEEKLNSNPEETKKVQNIVKQMGI